MPNSYTLIKNHNLTLKKQVYVHGDDTFVEGGIILLFVNLVIGWRFVEIYMQKSNILLYLFAKQLHIDDTCVLV
jgi:hypothetical protein